MHPSTATVLVVLALAVSTAGCSSGTGSAPVSYDAGPAARTARAASINTLRPSDQIRLQVYDEAAISGDYQIDGSGAISVPLAGRIRAAGLTPAQLERALVTQLTRGGLKEPRVNVQVTTYAPFYVHGEVERSGEFPYRPGLTVMDAVAIAGGFTYRADERRAVLRRAGTGVEQIVALDSSLLIFPGDNLRIQERFF